MSGLQREVLRWLQSLDLTWQIKTPKWDLTNGYLMAEIFSWYFPQEIQMHMYNNGTSLDSKLRNWSLLKNFFKRHNLEIPEHFVEGTIHCKEGAAQLLVEKIYEVLTNRQIRKQAPEHEIDFTDRAYQVKLPMHARSTATQAVKNNLRITELMADKNLILGQQKAQCIINDHIEHRKQERKEDPDRFDKKPTLGELAPRRVPPQSRQSTNMSSVETPLHSANMKDRTDEECMEDNQEYPTELTREPTVTFTEVQVHQLDSPQNQFHTSIVGY